MVLPDSHGVARAPWYSGVCPRSRFDFAYGGVTLFATAFQRLPLSLRFLTSRPSCRTDRQILQPPSSNACRLALDGFGLVPVRSPLLRESRLISFPPGTEMVQFPGLALCSPAFPGLGFPIRKSPCRRSLASSTGLIAGSYVLHRLLMPRHPPYALIYLTQFSLFSRSAPASAFTRPRARSCEVPEAARADAYAVRSGCLFRGCLDSASISPATIHVLYFERTKFPGGDRRDRTADLLLAKQALSQLSYAPVSLRIPAR